MSTEFLNALDADLPAFLADFGQTITWTHGGTPTDITAIFDNAYLAALPELGGVMSASPAATLSLLRGPA